MYDLKKLLVAAILLTLSLGAYAQNPALQVDIAGGTYVAGSEDSVITSDSSFTTYVYADATSTRLAGAFDEYFYLSVALTTTNGSSILDNLIDSDIGEYTVDGATYSISSMTYGTPPMDLVSNPGLLGPHEIYSTYYLQVAFKFDTTTEYNYVNVQDNPGEALVLGTGMYAQAFDISKLGLSGDYQLHFDAYNLDANGQVNVFAPFSHDAGTAVPESTSLLLLMVGLLGLVGFKRKIS